MNNKLIILLPILFMFGCQSKMKEPAKQIVSLESSQEQIKPFSNPSIIYGASFGNFFQSLYRTNKYDLMLAFTSTKTIKHFGRNNVMQYYNGKFKFDYKLGPLSNLSNDGGVTTLTYAKASIYGTRRKIIFDCVLENDSIKIILKSLNKNPFE